MPPPTTPTVVVPCEPTTDMLIAGSKALDLWSDDALREEIDCMDMARKVWAAMTSVPVVSR